MPQTPSPYYEDRVAASDPLRTEQARELERYVEHLKKSRRPSTDTKKLRARFAQSIGWPPPGLPDPTDTPSVTKLGEDGIGTYYRAIIPILPSVHAEGIYIVPKNATGKVPLVISMHGGGGSPEVALFNGGANYHDMVRGGVKNGYAVFAPQHLFRAEGFPGDIRTRTDERLKLVGTSLTAVEIAKITRSLDVLLKRPELDPKRVAMVGLSYGGYYALVTPALEPRIKVAVSSCYFGVQEWRYERDELSVPTDFRFPGRFTDFLDSDLVALICPRPLLIQAGKNDNASHRDGGIELAPESAAHYQKRGKPENFEFLVFDGNHEFHDPSAWAFLKKHL